MNVLGHDSTALHDGKRCLRNLPTRKESKDTRRMFEVTSKEVGELLVRGARLYSVGDAVQCKRRESRGELRANVRVGKGEWWAIVDSNHGPQSYQDCALTV